MEVYEEYTQKFCNEKGISAELEKIERKKSKFCEEMKIDNTRTQNNKYTRCSRMKGSGFFSNVTVQFLKDKKYKAFCVIKMETFQEHLIQQIIQFFHLDPLKMETLLLSVYLLVILKGAK